MALFKCKMCGGDLVLTEGSALATCEYCGTTQTVPAADNEKKLTLFSRANRLRFGCEFDKAAGVYEALVADFPQEAEAYWGLVLCKYGIEYVDDPATGKKIPTCHRSSFDSIMEDKDFEQALENCDAIARRVYREEAKQIEEVRKGIIAVSSNEQPYDVFICYKETAENGERTLDSVLAQDVYDALTEKGYRVFFSRITLEDKLGVEYEPYIFAALHSAKVMLAFGTDYEYYNAVWVRNEWSRFLKLMEKDKSKHLIPCFKGIDAYDMPKEFAKLQAQDLGKVGATQDLLRGIDKLIKPATREKVVASEGTDLIQDTLKRAYAFMNEEDWTAAKKCLDTVLGYDPHNVTALIGILMHELKVPQEQKLAGCGNPLEKEESYQQAIKYADDATKARLEEYNRATIYNFAMAQSKLPGGIGLAIKQLERIPGWGDAQAQLAILQEKQKQAQKKRKRIIAAVAAALALVVAVILFLDFKADYLDPLGIYNDATALMEQSNYLEAAEVFNQVKDFKDSKDLITECKYLYAKSLFDAGDYVGAETAFKKVDAYKDAQGMIKESKYLYAKSLMEQKNYLETVEIFNQIKGFKDSNDLISECNYLHAKSLFDAGNYDDAIKIFQSLHTYKDSADKVLVCHYHKAIALKEARNYKGAISHFQEASGYKDSDAQIEACKTAILDQKYDAAIALKNDGKLEGAIAAFRALGEYRDSVAQIDGCYKTVYVSTPQELLENIGDFTKIVLTSSYYNLSHVSEVVNSKVEGVYAWNSIGSYKILGVNHLKIVGDATIVIEERDAHVLTFENCKNIELSGLTIGHSLRYDEYPCGGSVISLDDCVNVLIDNSNLFGCGATGLSCYASKNVTLENSDIYDCTNQGIWLGGGSTASVKNCKFYDFDIVRSLISATNASKGIFENCTFTNIACSSLAETMDSLFDSESSSLTFKSCTIKDCTYTDLFVDTSERQPTTPKTTFVGCTIE